jgi:hypothetical protein
MVNGMQFSTLTASGLVHWLPEPMKQAVDQHKNVAQQGNDPSLGCTLLDR